MSAEPQRVLTERQKEILEFIAKHTTEKQMAPTIREIGDHFAIGSTNAVNDHLAALAHNGVITRSEQKARSIVLTTKGRIICGLVRLKDRDALEQAAKVALGALLQAAPVLARIADPAERSVNYAAELLRKAGVR